MLLVLQVDEAVRRVPAGERINGNIYALAIWRGVSVGDDSTAVRFK
jgi:hypothetical protein